MRGLSLFLLVLAFAFSSAGVSSAQAVRKVAILEVADKDDAVDAGTKLLLGIKLADAIASTNGYEALERVDMESILGEHNFHRSGLVDENQIAKLGEMTGANYVLVSEVAPIGNDKIVVAAKLIDVETTTLFRTANTVSGMDAESIENACTDVAAKLIGRKRGTVVRF